MSEGSIRCSDLTLFLRNHIDSIVEGVERLDVEVGMAAYTKGRPSPFSGTEIELLEVFISVKPLQQPFI